MLEQDPNLFPFQGLYAWSEPWQASRLRWTEDKWRYYKMALLPLVIFTAAAAGHLLISVGAFALTAGIAATIVAIIWGTTFLPRNISLFSDKIALGVRSARSFSAPPSIFYRDIIRLESTPEATFYRAALVLKNGTTVSVFPPTSDALEHLKKALSDA